MRTAVALISLLAATACVGQVDEANRVARVRFLVRAVDGAPAADATIILRGFVLPAMGLGGVHYNTEEFWCEVKGKTGADGRGELEWPLRGLLGYFVAEARGPGTIAGVSLTGIDTEKRVITLTLRPTLDVRFRVRRPDGSPVRGARLALDSLLGENKGFRHWTTDDRGEIQCELDHRAATLRTAAHVSVRVDGAERRASLSGNGEPLLFDVTEAWGPDLEVTWDAKDGVDYYVNLWPVPRAIGADSKWMRGRRRQVVRGGRTWFSALEPGSWRYLTVEAAVGPAAGHTFRVPNHGEGYRDPVVTVAGPSHLRLALKGPGTTRPQRFRMLDMHGNPLANLTLDVVHHYSDPSRTPGNPDRGPMVAKVDRLRRGYRQLKTDENGILEIQVWADRPGKLVVQWPGIHSVLGGTLVGGMLDEGLGRVWFPWDPKRSDTLLDVHVLLRPAATGMVVDADGKPAAGASVHLHENDRTEPQLLMRHTVWSVDCDAQGRFDLRFPFAVEGALLQARGPEGGPDCRKSRKAPFRMGQTGIVLKLSR